MSRAFLNFLAITGTNLLEAGDIWPLVGVQTDIYSLNVFFHEGKVPNKLHRDDPRFRITLANSHLLVTHVWAIKPADFYFKSAGKIPVDVWADFQAATRAVQFAAIRYHIADLLDQKTMPATIREVPAPAASVA